MAHRKKLVNDFAAFMIVIIVGSLITGAIEGINIGRNVKTYNTFYEEINPQDYLVFNFEIKEAARLYLYCRAENTSIYSDDADVIFAIMRDSKFIDWVEAGSLAPEILNCTFYYDDSYIDVNNLAVPYEDTYYFIIFNNNPYIIEAYVDVDIVPWGHIIVASIMVILLLFGIIGFTSRVIHAVAYNSKLEKRATQSGVETQNVEVQEITQKEGVFCQSCGSPLTPKDTRYCPQCGASV